MNTWIAIVFTVVSACALLLILIRVCGINQLTVGGRTISLSVETSDGDKERISKKDLACVLLWALSVRLLVYLFSAYAAPLFDVGDGTLSDLATRWGNWDGNAYLRLAEYGYAGYEEEGQHLYLVFFPLYPWLIRAFHLLIPNYQACAYLVSNFSFIAGCGFLYALAAHEWNKTAAMRAVILLSLFPFSFFFGAVRTESLFFLTSVASLYYIRKHNFLAATVWGALASLTRMHGILLIIAAGAEILAYYRPIAMLKSRKFKEFKELLLTKVLFIPFIAVGSVLYLCLNYYIEGNCFIFLTYEKEHWYQSSQFFTKTFDTILTQASTTDELAKKYVLWLPQFVLFIFALLVLIYGIRRIHATYSIYFFVYLFLNYSITWPLSCGRYMTCAIPMFLILAKGSEKHPYLYRWLLAAFTLIQACFIPLFLNSTHLY